MKVSSQIMSLVPYRPGKPIAETQREYGLKQVIKLASNENPLGTSPKVHSAITHALSEVARYPDPHCFELREKVAAYYDVPQAWLGFGNGSNEVIDLLIRIFCEPGEAIITSQQAFIAYKICAQAARVNVVEVPMTSDLCFDLEALAQSLQKNSESARLIFIANPNNPTGTYVTHDQLLEFLKRVSFYKNTLVVLDEAYNEFVRAKDYPRTRELLNNFENLVLIRTFSKVFGLAGLRLGTLIARPRIIDFFDRVRNPFNVNSLAQVASVAALEDKDFLTQSQKLTWEGLDYFYDRLSKLGLKYWPSQANFVLFELSQPAQNVYEALLKKGVIMRPVGAYGMPCCLRLSVGLSKENELAMQALGEILS